jgi:hypothetical protein
LASSLEILQDLGHILFSKARSVCDVPDSFLNDLLFPLLQAEDQFFELVEEPYDLPSDIG